MSTGDQRRPGLTGTVIRGVSLAGGGFLLARAITLVTFVILARLITPEELGEFTAGSLLVGIGLLLAGSGMSAALIHRRDRLEEAAATAVVATVLAGVLIALLGLAISPLLGSFFDSGTVTDVAAVMSGVLFLQSARMVPNALLQRRFSFLRRLIVDPVAAIAFGIAAIIATANGMGVWGLVVGQYAFAVTDFALSWGLVQWRPQFRLVSFGMWRELVGYGRHVLAGSTIRRLGDRIPILMAGGFLGTGSVGQLQYANRIVSTPFSVLIAGISYVVFPAYARISADPKRFLPAFLRSLRWAALVAMPIGLILAPLGEPLAILAFGERWALAGEVTVALCLFIPAQTIASEIGEGFKGTGNPATRTVVIVIGVASGAAAMAILAPIFGLIGVAAGISIDATVSAICAVILARRVMQVPMPAMLAAIAAPGAAALLMVAVLFPLENLLVNAASHGTAVGLLLLTLEGLFGFAIYALAVWMISPSLLGELKEMMRDARRTRGQSPDVEVDEELLDEETGPVQSI